MASVSIAAFGLTLAVLAVAPPVAAETPGAVSVPSSTSGLAVLGVIGLAGLAVMGARPGDDDPDAER